ncbi:hypothetical protein GCM10010492_16460 [Saccharothrix mutabilis subsp. mutabilis]|uniref:Uncharacterized protein n=1 Tax=Saccharothrix mutabilis subsp. mutabilis TaxID=66855 RepID=A0ABN0TDV6_9PSEU
MVLSGVEGPGWAPAAVVDAPSRQAATARVIGLISLRSNVCAWSLIGLRQFGSGHRGRSGRDFHTAVSTTTTWAIVEPLFTLQSQSG